MIRMPNSSARRRQRRLLLVVVVVASGTAVGFVSLQRGFSSSKQQFILGPLRQDVVRPAAFLALEETTLFFDHEDQNENVAVDVDVDIDVTIDKTGTIPKRRESKQVILLSLQHPEQTGRFCKTVADVWRWKDAVLGDGRDFFVPRPNTLAALQRYLVSQLASTTLMIDAVVVLSNCARLELLVVVLVGITKEEDDDDDSTSSRQQDTSKRNDSTSSSLVSSLQEGVSHALLRQVQHVQGLRFGPPPMDWPATIATDPPAFSSSTISPGTDMLVQELARHWKSYDTMPAILTHWCHVAAGLAARPNRPDRGHHKNDDNDSSTSFKHFRPFSSRDAHIMLQMKRLVCDDHATTKWIVDTALAAGKAARSNTIVQAQRPLLLDSNQVIPVAVARQVQRDVLAPLVEQALVQWQARAVSGTIRQLRQRALALGQTDAERHFIHRSAALHNVTMALRQTTQTYHHHYHQHLHVPENDDDKNNNNKNTVNLVDIVDSFLRGLEQRLAEQRCKARTGNSLNEWDGNQ